MVNIFLFVCVLSKIQLELDSELDEQINDNNYIRFAYLKVLRSVLRESDLIYWEI